MKLPICTFLNFKSTGHGLNHCKSADIVRKVPLMSFHGSLPTKDNSQRTPTKSVNFTKNCLIILWYLSCNLWFGQKFGFFISLDFIKHKHLFFWRIFIFYIALYYLTFSILDVVNSIKVPQVGVPSYAIQGKKAVLECPYILDGSEELYSVKWYKNGREFFR